MNKLAGATMAAVLLAFPAVSAMVYAPSAQAESAERSVEGKVLNAKEEPLEKAIVFLKDTRTLAIKSVTTGKDGGFHFVQLSGANDYEVWAELAGKKSSVKTISSFDTRKHFVLVLKFKQ